MTLKLAITEFNILGLAKHSLLLLDSFEGFFYFLFLIGSHSSSGGSGIHYLAQAGLEPTPSSALASQVLGLEA